ncbi:MAG TPA: orotidine 5'-phosphate decarboxylase / HUMPS family protein [Candidatus Nitrosotenuis sp.]|jgi:orotidine-5'-phosphate decarboxylase|nr:orotidine 5'-phosphate decarboxylase / HUMPS family protein [Candidatus Nitrosotenuis sp.]
MALAFKTKWLNVVRAKKSQLCIGLDPAEHGQRANQTLPPDRNKVEWCLDFIKKVSPYAAAIKINRNFIKDLSRKETQKICHYSHEHGMLTIDDAKLCDVGSSNHAGFYHAAQEGFDAITYSPFPGNIDEATSHAHDVGLGIIVLILMSNPQFLPTKLSLIDGIPFFDYWCQHVIQAKADGVVIGAISPSNHLTPEQVSDVGSKLEEQLILVPGLGEQDGDVRHHLKLFGNRSIINVGRAILFASDVAQSAKNFNQYCNDILRNESLR